MQSIQQKSKTAFETLRAAGGYTNPMQTPRLRKVVLSAGIGSFKDKKKMEIVKDRIARIAGQKPAIRGAKKAIAAFKTRVGDPIGVTVTLRGARMRGFLEKLLHVALPRTKDFRGIPASAIDEMGNLTIGIREQTIFPETSDEEIKDVFGMAVTVVTSARNPKEARMFLEYLGFPFQKGKSK